MLMTSRSLGGEQDVCVFPEQNADLIGARELLRKYFLWKTFRPVTTTGVDARVVPVPSLVHTAIVSHT